MSTAQSQVPFVSGLDVSHWQGTIDWQTVAQNGVDFVFIKATDGLASDPYFIINWGASKPAGLLRSAYHFFRPLHDPAQQADAFLKNIEPGCGELPPALDLESSIVKSPAGAAHDEWDDLPLSERLPRVTAWLERVRAGCGALPVIYTAASFWDDKFAGTSALQDHPLWVANYTNQPAPKVPAGWKQWHFWQFSQSGTVAGIRGKVDLDRFNGKSGELYAMMAGAPKVGGPRTPHAVATPNAKPAASKRTRLPHEDHVK